MRPRAHLALKSPAIRSDVSIAALQRQQMLHCVCTPASQSCHPERLQDDTRRKEAYPLLGWAELSCLLTWLGPFEFATFLAQLASVATPVLAGKRFLLFFRAENLAPLSTLQDELIPTLKDLKWCAYLIHLVELH